MLSSEAESDPIAHYQLGHELWQQSDYAGAIRHFDTAISLDADHLDAEVFACASWLLSTCPILALRNPMRAIEHATRACDLTDWLEGWTIGILAAAHYSAGNQLAAVQLQRRACDNAFDFDRQLQHRHLELMQAGKPLPFSSYP
jgi:tetratricopeptide (TPR) repeat protein